MNKFQFLFVLILTILGAVSGALICMFIAGSSDIVGWKMAERFTFSIFVGWGGFIGNFVGRNHQNLFDIKPKPLTTINSFTKDMVHLGKEYVPTQFGMVKPSDYMEGWEDRAEGEPPTRTTDHSYSMGYLDAMVGNPRKF